jgi:glucosamine--fructose-6-phosphate aminotransferase (isomerizing)
VTDGAHSRQEILTQGAAWQGALDAVQAQREPLTRWLASIQGRELFFTGCGSTHYLSLFAAPFFQAVAGWRCRGVPASELALQTESLVAPGAAPGVVAVSRSGETSETVLAVEKLAAGGARALAISCYDDKPLSAAVERTIAIPQGREESFAQTRSFAGMLVAAQALAALAADDAALWDELGQLPALAEPLIARADPLARAIGQDETIKRITYLGAGPLYGLANEATVKMKEMSLSLAEAYHCMEFRHGPMSLVDGEHLVVALLSQAMRPYEAAVLRDLRARGARILAIGNDLSGMEGLAEAVFDLETTLPERAQPVLYLPLLQLMAYHRALGRGLNPDRPRNVVAAIVLSGVEMMTDEQAGV